MQWADNGTVASVEITGQEIAGITKQNQSFHTYAPSQYEGLANKLIDRGVVIRAKEPTASPWASIAIDKASRSSLTGWPPYGGARH